jgi:hypothetical protein
MAELYGLGFCEELGCLARGGAIGEGGEDVELLRYAGGGLYVLAPPRRTSAALSNFSSLIG